MTANKYWRIALVAGLALSSCDTAPKPEEDNSNSTVVAPPPPPKATVQVADSTEPTQSPEPVFTTAPKTTTLNAEVMTVPYQVTVGRVLSTGEQAQAQTIIDATFLEIDRTFNKWNPNSELSRLNAMEAEKKAPISRTLERFLLECSQIVHMTDGRFDPTMLPLHDLWREKLEQGTVPNSWEIEELEAALGWDKIHVEGGFFSKGHDKTALDLGGIVKGHAVDLIVERLAKAGFGDTLVEWGGEIRTSGQHPDARPWRVFISRLGDSDPRNAIDTLDLHDMSLATSGDYHQYWNATEGDTEHQFSHIVNPKTRRALEISAISVASVSVLAPKCMLADGLATAAMLFDDAEEAKHWAHEVQAKIQGTAFWIITRGESEQAL